MRIGHNITALNTYKSLQQNFQSVNNATEKLSSGLKINRASDDAAGLSISEKMRGQIRGLSQASRNAQDAISLIQTAEGGLNEVHSLLQRGRELSVQAVNDTNTESDRNSIQDEISQILKEVDRIANTTEFNTKKLLNVSSSEENIEKKKLLEALQKSWLQQSENLIANGFGLTADGANMEFIFVADSGDDKVAWVQGSYYPTGTDGRYFDQKMYLDMSDFSPVTWPNGGGSWISNDRIIAHEMVHAVMGRTTNFRDIPTWFKEGAAEFLAGADERLSNDLLIAGSESNLISNASLSGGWVGDSAHYSTAYAAVKFLDSQISGGIATIMNDIKLSALGGNEKSFEQAIIDNSTYTDINDFYTDFQGGNGATFISTLDLADADTGAIGGGNDASTVPDTANLTTDPLTGFTEIWPTFTDSGKDPLSFHLGANSSQNLKLNYLNVTSENLGIASVNVVNDLDGGAIDAFDAAIAQVSSNRSKLGAVQNRLEHTIANQLNSEENLTAAESRIRDVDMAKEIMNQTKSTILMQAAQAMLAQGNQQPQAILQLIS